MRTGRLSSPGSRVDTTNVGHLSQTMLVTSMPTRTLLVTLAATLIGSAATLTSKAMYQIPSFSSKTFAGALFVSFGMALNWPLHLLLRCHRRRGLPSEPLLPREMGADCTQLSPLKPLSRYRFLILPTLLDLSTTVLLNLAFEHAPASAVQMVTSAGLVVVAILAHVLLGTRHTPVQWAGVASAAMGLACVGGAAALATPGGGGSASTSSSSALLGVSFAAASTVTAGVGWVLEERYLKAGLFAPIEQVGVEGTLECLLLLAILYPALQVSGGEDVVDAAHSVSSDSRLLCLGMATCVCLAVYNPLSQYVAALEGTVLRQFAAVLRVVFVWAGGLVLDGATDGRFGENWNAHGSSLELVGFGFICSGLLLFTRRRAAEGGAGGTRLASKEVAASSVAASSVAASHHSVAQGPWADATAAPAGPSLPPPIFLCIGGEPPSQSTDTELLASMRARSCVRVEARLPAVRALYEACGHALWSQPEAVKHRIAMPTGVKTGVRGGAEYGNAGYLCIDGDKEYCTLRRRADGRSLPPLPYLGGVRADADGGGKAGELEGELEAELEAMAMRAHQELQAVGERVLDGFEHALVREAAGEARARAATAPSSAGAAAPLPSRSSLSRLLHYVGAASLEPAGREPEESNVTLSLLRYARKGADVATSASDSGEVNAGIQPQGTGIPCAPHTDASMLTLIVAPTQPGLEVFATSHPTAEASAAAAVAVYKRGRGEGGEGDATAAGAETAGAWVSGFEPHELTRLREGAQWAGAADRGDDLVMLVAMGGDMLVHATGGALPATRHRVVCWPASTQRLSMIMGMYGADDNVLEPAVFRERVCGLPPMSDSSYLADITCRASRMQKLYLDPDVRSDGKPDTRGKGEGER